MKAASMAGSGLGTAVDTGGVLIYDGDCGFCKRSLGWAITLGITCDYAPWQAADLASLGLSEDDVQEAAWYVAEGGRWRGHEAIARSLRTSRFGSVRAAGWLLGTRIVAPVGRWVYQWIADHRYQLPGGTAACKLE